MTFAVRIRSLTRRTRKYRVRSRAQRGAQQHDGFARGAAGAPTTYVLHSAPDESIINQHPRDFHRRATRAIVSLARSRAHRSRVFVGPLGDIDIRAPTCERVITSRQDAPFGNKSTLNPPTRRETRRDETRQTGGRRSANALWNVTIARGRTRAAQCRSFHVFPKLPRIHVTTFYN